MGVGVSGRKSIGGRGGLWLENDADADWTVRLIRLLLVRDQDRGC